MPRQYRTKSKKYEIICRYCGKKFKGNSTTLFCSQSCRGFHFKGKYITKDFVMYKVVFSGGKKK